jgi:Fur family ferric uptake transcriptional regulator
MEEKKIVRDTSQRRALRKVFQATEDPLTPHELLDRAKAIVPKMGIATVYRNVKALHDEGFLRAIELPNQPVRYQRAGIRYNHHFLCESCDSVFNVPTTHDTCLNLVPTPFRAKRHELVIYGECPTCQDEEDTLTEDDFGDVCQKENHEHCVHH